MPGSSQKCYNVTSGCQFMRVWRVVCDVRYVCVVRSLFCLTQAQPFQPPGRRTMPVASFARRPAPPPYSRTTWCSRMMWSEGSEGFSFFALYMYGCYQAGEARNTESMWNLHKVWTHVMLCVDMSFHLRKYCVECFEQHVCCKDKTNSFQCKHLMWHSIFCWFQSLV